MSEARAGHVACTHSLATHVAVAACLAQCMPCEEEARPQHRPLIHSCGQSPVSAASVSDSGEPPHQHTLQHFGCPCCNQAVWQGQQARQVGCAGGAVDMRVAQACRGPGGAGRGSAGHCGAVRCGEGRQAQATRGNAVVSVGCGGWNTLLD